MLEYLRNGPPAPDEGSPLLVLLHGRGSHSGDLQSLRRVVPPGGTLVTPQAPHPGGPWGYGPGWAWYRYLGEDRADGRSLSHSLRALGEFLDALPGELGFEPGPVVLGGFSQGGTTSLAYAMTAPGGTSGPGGMTAPGGTSGPGGMTAAGGRSGPGAISGPGGISGLVNLSGFLINPQSMEDPLTGPSGAGGGRSRTEGQGQGPGGGAASGTQGPEALGEIPVFWGHGTEDPAVPFALAVAGRTRLEQAGVRVEARDYQMGHRVSAEELDHLGTWLRNTVPGWV